MASLGGQRSEPGSRAPRSVEWLGDPRVSVVIPAVNEADNLPHVVASIPEWVHEVVLVDGGSTDGTPEVARAVRPDVKVVRQVGSGKGDALLRGFEVCTGEIIVTIDADGSADGAEIARFVAALEAGADFVKGSRFLDGGGSADLKPLRRLGNRFLGRIANLLHGTRYTDFCYGYNAFWRRTLERIQLDCSGFELEAQMNIRAARGGLAVKEVPSFEALRLHGQSNLRTFRDGWRILRLIVAERSHPREVAPRPELPTLAVVPDRTDDGPDAP
jgi:glycosyltransferase involved in cell wall biosynthesis